MVALAKRTEAMVNFLKEKGIDTLAIEAQFTESNRRAAALISAYDTYRQVYESTSQDVPDVRRSLREGARRSVVQSVSDFSEHYRTSIFVPLQAAYEKSL